MLPHKKDDPFLSVPASRIGLSSRLNQLNRPSSRPTSRAGTPGPYVTSTLNPNKNVPQTSSNLQSRTATPNELDAFEDLPIIQSLREFEDTFAQLSQSISSFKEEEVPSKVEQLIEADKAIVSGLRDLRTHQKLGKEIELLQERNNELSSQSTHILKELIACRSDLKKLPRLPAAKNRTDPSLNAAEIGVQELLDYSMKLAKFSKAPASVMGQMPHPNNFIWPAEDALRRGMLAMASLKPDEILKAELGEEAFQAKKEESEKKATKDEDVEMEDVETKEEPAAPSPKKEEKPQVDLDSDILEDEKPAAPPAPKPAPQPASKPESNTLDLDLFDPDEDDDDSD